MNMGGILRDGWVLMLPRDDELPHLHRAARNGDLEEVARCLESGADPESLAVVQRSDQLIERMQLDGRAESRFPALHAAVQGGEITVVRKLLDSGADPNIRWHCISLGSHLLADGDQGTALVLAARANRTDIMALLMEHGVSPDADPEIVQELAEKNQAAALRLLIERTLLPVDLGALFLTAAHHSAGDVLRLLQEQDNALVQTTEGPESARVTGKVDGFLPAGAPPRTGVDSSQRVAALKAAAGYGAADIVRLLLSWGAAPEDTQEAFRIACRSQGSTLKVIRLLLEHGVDARGANGASPELLEAVRLQKQDRARLLLAHGAPVNGRYRYPYLDQRNLFPRLHRNPPCTNR